MFYRILQQMKLMGLSKRGLAKLTGMRYNTLLAKMNGKTTFTFDEALSLRKALRSEDSIEDLFERDTPAIKSDTVKIIHNDDALPPTILKV